jgi:DNA-binding beta-propeller fold protein YncE
VAPQDLHGKPDATAPRLEWRQDWQTPDHDGRSTGWAHHGVAVTSNGDVVTFAEDRPVVQVLAPDGSIKRAWEAPVLQGHGLRVSRDADTEVLWIADNGEVAARTATGEYEYVPAEGTVVTGAVVKLTLDGDELQRLDVPPHPSYQSGSYCPTDICVDEPHLGGSGDLWVADGYGQQLVHRFDAAGNYLTTISGVEGAGAFVEPHALHIDRRSGAPELFVADRGNSRIQVFDLEGRFLRAIGEGVLTSPGGFAQLGKYLVVAELDARLTDLDIDGEVVQVFGDTGPADRSRPAWPNRIGDSGTPVRPILPAQGFNTPHGIASDPDGNLYVTEWLIGGRISALRMVVQPEV